MTYLPVNPLPGSIAQSTQVQGNLSVEKTRQVRRAQNVSRNVAAEGDRFEHQVENAEATAPIHDDQNPRQQQRGKRKPASAAPTSPSDEPPHVDIKA